MLTTPEPINSTHSLQLFDCGNTHLNQWLKTKACKNEKGGASRTYVVCDHKRVVAYYALATGAIDHDRAPNKMSRNMPNPIPIMVLGRLGVDLNYQHKGIGKGLLKDAILRTLQVSYIVGVKALLVHAISKEAKAFYTQNGFIESPIDPMTLFVSIKSIEL